jgi:large subunit ribosomal protein L44e
MKIPKTRRTHCPFCRKQTEHKVTEAKRKTPGSRHPLGYGSRIRAKRRGRLSIGNKGKYSKPPISKWKMAGKKSSKKTDFRFQCTVCKKIHTQRFGIRTKRVEFV